MQAAISVLKLGGELLEEPTRLAELARVIAAWAAEGPVVVVHGGGREIDAEAARHGIEKRAVDGLRITDEPTLDVVVAVLAGVVNPRLVSALAAAGAPAVGLTGADATCVPVEPAPLHRAQDGRIVDLGRVGRPVRSTSHLVRDLLSAGYVPVMASLGVDGEGRFFNVNADTLAGHLATSLGAERLVIAGATAGVLDGAGGTIDRLDASELDRLAAAGTVSAGMVAKLAACREALAGGVRDVRIVDGRSPSMLRAREGTQVVGSRPAAGVRVEPSGRGAASAMISAEDLRAREGRYVLQNYQRSPVVFVRGQGAHLYDADGRAYLDLLSGIGVASLGHAHPRLAAALAEQVATLAHTSNLFYHPLQGELAERLASLSGLPRAFFCNSGTEAVEACLKFSRKYWRARGEVQRTQLVALEHSFHGRTFGSLSVTWEPSYRTPFVPLLPDVRFVPPNDEAALREAVTPSTAAIIYEPIQGESGVRPLNPAFAEAIGELSASTGCLLIADEVQSGLGRTGDAFYGQRLALRPHLMALGKALGAGMPVGAALVGEEVAGTVAYGDHGSTYGGNLLACRAALVFLDELVERGLLAEVARLGAIFNQRLLQLATAHDAIVEVRGAGLMRGLQLSMDAAPVVEAALRRGLVVNRAAGTVIRMLPPLTITEEELERGVAMLDDALGEARASAAARPDVNAADGGSARTPAEGGHAANAGRTLSSKAVEIA